MRAEGFGPHARATAWPGAFARSPADRAAALSLMALRGITPKGLLKLAREEGTASAVLGRIRAGRGGSEQDQAAARTLDSERLAEALEACGARFVTSGDAEYPAQLEHLADPPLGLFVRGAGIGHVGSMVAIVGARRCSDLGRDMSRALGRAIASAGLTVVSGAARGIDAAAHEGALAGGGPTVAVLGCGIDCIYPPGSAPLVRRILGTGTVVSEYPPGVPPDGFRFPARNRIVVALARAVVVVEGADRSGSLISAEHALDLGRDVFAVPGMVTNPVSQAPHQLIREGATLITGPDDLLADLGLQGGGRAVPSAPDLPPAERAALDAVLGPVVPDRVAAALGLTVPEALALLLRLEMRGLLRSVGGRFERRLGDHAAVAPSGREGAKRSETRGANDRL